MQSSFRLLRVRGIEIGATWSWLLIFGFIIFQLSTQLFPVAYAGLSTTTYWAMGVASGVLFVVSLLLHELGHALRAQKEGMEIEGITLWLFGGVARFKGMFPTAGAEFRIAVAGPLVTVALAIVFGALWFGLRAVGAPLAVVGVPNYLWQINGLLLVFNMIPALPLDGGRVLRSALWQAKGNFAAATVSAARVGRVLAGGLIGFGVLGFLTGSGQGLWLAIVGWFILQAGQAELAYALFRQTLSGLRVRDLMTPNPQAVDPEMTIAGFIDEVAHIRGHSTYPVVDAFGRLVGMISLRLAAQVPAEERLRTRVRDVMVQREEIPVVSPDTEITDAATLLQGGSGRAIVEQAGLVHGILSMSDIARAIEIEQIRAPAPAEGARRSRRALWGLFAVAAVLLIAWWYTPPYVHFAPGDAFDVTGDIAIKGADIDKVDGQYVLTSVAVQQPNLIGLVVGMAQGRQTVPLSAVVPADVDPDEFFEQQEALFEETQKVATAAAAEAAGFDVSLRGTGAQIASILRGSPAADVLEEDDVITAINGERVRLSDDVARRIRSRPTGTSFSLEIERDGRKRTVDVRSRSGVVEGAPGIGVLLQTRDFDVDLPFEISFRKREIGGPSAGLTYALAVYDLLEEADVADGRIIASSGTIDLEGRVGPVGGVEEKAVAAKRANAELFIVPEEEIRLVREPDLDVLGVGTLKEAIEELR